GRRRDGLGTRCIGWTGLRARRSSSRLSRARAPRPDPRVVRRVLDRYRPRNGRGRRRRSRRRTPYDGGLVQRGAVVKMEPGNEDGRGVGRYLDMQIREVTTGEGPVRLVGSARPSAAVLDGRGRMHMGVLGTMCDAIGGFCGGLGALPDGWVVTTNL